MTTNVTDHCSIFLPSGCDGRALDVFFEELDTLLEEGVRSVDIDCSLLDHARSGHINALWDALTRCEEAGVKMRLTSTGYGLERLLEVLGLRHLFTLEPVERSPRTAGAPLAFGATRQTAFSAELRPGMDDITGAFIRLHDFLKRLQVSEMHIFDLETVFYEVCSNILRHAELPVGSLISFSATLHGNDLELRFVDEGRPFDPTGNSRDFDHREAIRREQHHGLGISMIRRLVDEISYLREDDARNVVRLRKRVAQGGEGC